MSVVFYPQYNIARRYRYQSEIKGRTRSYLHSKESEFRLDNLENFQNWQLKLIAINCNNTERHEGVTLHYSETNIFDNNVAIIKSNQIKFDFIEIKIIKKSKLKGRDKENLRILAELRHPDTDEKFEIVSKIIRNKGPEVTDDLDILSIGRPPSTPNWERSIITFKKSLLYYPEEMTLRINDRIINCSPDTNSLIKYNSYEFLIPGEILRKKEELICILECLPFQKSTKFSNKFFDVEKRKRKLCEDFHTDISCQVHTTVSVTEEPVVKKPMLEEQDPDLYLTPRAETSSGMNFENVCSNVFNFHTELENTPIVETENSPNQSLYFEDFGDFGDFGNFGDFGDISLDEANIEEDKLRLMETWDANTNLELDDIDDILKRCL